MAAAPDTALATTQVRPAGRSRPHIDALDLMRPLAAFAVMATHSMQAYAYSTSLLYGAGLVASQASRHVFFFVSALVLTYQAYDRPRWSVPRFWGRRLVSVGVPYLVWTTVYFLLGFTVLQGGLAIPVLSGTPTQKLATLGWMMVTGAGHLYFVAVLAQFYVVFPAFLWLLRWARNHHVLLLAVSFAVQVGVTIGFHYWGLDQRNLVSDISATRELTSYQFYLVAGGVVGAHLAEVRRWARRYWLPLVAGAVLVVICAEAWYLLAVRLGDDPLTASDPFSPQYVPSYLAAILLLYLAGEWWAGRARDGWFSRLVRSASDSSYGAYLSQAVFIDMLATLGLKHLQPGVPWYVLAAATAVAAFVAANLLTAVLTRTPLSRWTVGRARRPLIGGPPSVGRGTAGFAGSRGRRAVSLEPAEGG